MLIGTPHVQGNLDFSLLASPKMLTLGIVQTSLTLHSLNRIFHFSLLYPIHTIVHDCGSGACDYLTKSLVGREVESQ